MPGSIGNKKAHLTDVPEEQMTELADAWREASSDVVRVGKRLLLFFQEPWLGALRSRQPMQTDCPLPAHLLTGPQHASYSSLTLLCVCTCCPVSVAPPLALSPTRAGDLPIWVTAISTVSSTQSEIQEVLNEHMNEFPKRDNLFFYTELQKGAA